MLCNRDNFLKRIVFPGLASATVIFSTIAYANQYLASAEKYLNDNQVNSAIIELKNAIQSSPKDSQARLMLGEIYLTRGNFKSAEKELSRALKLGADENKVTPLLARAILGLGQNEQVISLIEETHINNLYAKSELSGIKALAEVKLGDLDAAESTLQAAENSGFNTLYIRLGKISLDAAQKRMDTALASINQVLKDTDNNSDVWLLKGHIESAKNNFDEAVLSYTNAYKLSPDAFYYTFFIAQSLVISKRFDEAEKYANDLINLYPNQPVSNELVAIIFYSKKEYNKARIHADRAINNGSQHLSASLISSLSSYELKNYEQAYKTLSRINDSLPDNHYAKRLYIILQLKLGYIDEAILSMNQLNIETDENNQFLSKASLQLTKLGRDEEALKLAQKAATKASAANDLMLGLVKLAGNDSTGFDQLRSAMAEQSDKRVAELGLAFYYIQFGKLKEAEDTVDEWLKKYPDDVGALVLKGVIYQKSNQLDNAELQYKKVLDISEEYPQVRAYLAQTMALKGNWEEAFQLSFKAKTLSPNDKTANQILLTSSKKLNRLPEMIKLIDNQIQADRSNPELKIQKARALTLNQQSVEAINLLEALPEAQKSAASWSLLGDIYYTQQKWQDASNGYKKWLELAPTDAKAYVWNIHISEMTQKLTQGIQLADNAITMFPNDVRFPLMKAGLLLKSGELTASQTVLNGLDEDVRDTPYALQLQGLLYLANQKFDAAVKVHQRRYEKQPSIQVANALASVYVLNGQDQEAIDFLNEVINKYGTKAEPLEIKLANILVKTQPEKAISKYRDIVDREPDNIVALNNLAWLTMEKEQFDEACQYAEKAYQIATQNPQIADTYGYCLLKSGDSKSSLKFLGQAYEKKLNDTEIALHYAESLIADGQSEQAKGVLASITTDEPEWVAIKGKLEEKLNTDEL